MSGGYTYYLTCPRCRHKQIVTVQRVGAINKFTCYSCGASF